MSESLPLPRLLEGCRVIDPEYRYVLVNPAAAEQLRTTPERLLGRTVMEVHPGAESTELFAKIRACMERGGQYDLHSELLGPEGSIRWFHYRLERVPEGVALLSVDASPRRAAEAALRQAHRAMAVARSFHRAMSFTTAEAHLLVQLCETAVHSGGYYLAWVGLKDAGPGHPVRPVARSGNGDEYTEALDITWDEGPRGECPAGRALRTGGVAVAHLIDAEIAPWRTEMLARGFGAWLALPLMVDGVAIGVLNLYGEAGAFGEAERSLLEELADDVGYGLSNLRGRARLKESEERYRLLMEHAPVGIAVHSERKVVFANPEAVRLLGASSAVELEGMRVEDIVHPDGWAAMEDRARRLGAGEQGLYPAHDRYVRLDGTVVDVEVTAVPLTYNGKPAVQVTVVDISERLRAERVRRTAEDALRASEARFRHVFEAANVGKSLTLPTGEISVNRAYAEMLGYTQEELRGRSWQSLTPPEDVKAHEAQVAPLLRGERDTLRFEKRYLHKSGGTVWCDLSSALWRDAEGRPLGFITTVVDITERKKAEEALRDNEAFIRAVMDNLPIGVAVHTFEPIEFTYMNARFPALYRTTREALTRPNAFWAAAYPDPADRKVAMERVLPDIATGDQSRWRWPDIPIRRPGELNTYVGASAARIPGTELMVSLVWDETVRHRASAERKRLEQQLLSSQRMEAVGRLAGGVAHDFNNLLSVILSYAGFVADALADNDATLADVAEIQKAGERAATLTRQLLAFSRRQILQPEVINLNQMVRSMGKMLRRLLGEDVQVELTLGAELDNVLADPGQVDQVLMNLAVNARDAMPQGGRLTIETANIQLIAGAPELPLGLAPGRYVLLTVTDTGCGMPPEVQAHAFEPFYTTKEKGHGTGLGLSTVYGIVKQSGGAIRVESAPGTGTSFMVYLPRVEQPTTRRRPSKAVVVGGTETVLIVEDEDAVRRSAERILRSAGYRVLSADSGEDALSLCQDQGEEVDLLLADVVMPQMSGPELAAQLTLHRPRLKVLYMSGYTDDAIGKHGVLAPEIAFIGKPFAAVALASKVREVLDGQE